METIKLGISGFDNVELIGRGGSSLVYKALQTDLDREVALKVLNAGDDRQVLRRFDRERRAMGRLSLNDGIVPVYESGLTDRGLPYLVMPYYSAGSLADRMAAGPMRWQEAVGHLTLAAQTMAAAHDSDVVHLDLKPANILLSSEGSPRIADFGIAKLLGDQTGSRTTSAAFTPGYSAPEILMSGAASPAADVYGLGATLWALLAGRPPFRSDHGDNSLLAVAGRVIHQPPDDLRMLVPGPICDVIDKAMAKDPSARQATAGAFSQALIAAHEAAEGGSGSRVNRLGVVPSPIAPTQAATPPRLSSPQKMLREVAAEPQTGTVETPAAAAAAPAGRLHFDDSVPPRFVPAVAPSGIDDALNRFGPLAAFVGSLVILLGALFFVTSRGDDVTASPATSIRSISPAGLSDNRTGSVAPATSPPVLDPAGPASSDQATTIAFEVAATSRSTASSSTPSTLSSTPTSQLEATTTTVKATTTQTSAASTTTSSTTSTTAASTTTATTARSPSTTKEPTTTPDDPPQAPALAKGAGPASR